MPIIKSARKRVKIAAKAGSRNAKTKRTMRESLKTFMQLLDNGSPAKIAEAQRAAVSAIDMAAKKDVIHKNKAARKKAQIAKQAKSSGVKPKAATPKPATKKAVAKAKSPAKKPASKKPAAKKTPTKKPAPKK